MSFCIWILSLVAIFLEALKNTIVHDITRDILFSVPDFLLVIIVQGLGCCFGYWCHCIDMVGPKPPFVYCKEHLIWTWTLWCMGTNLSPCRCHPVCHKWSFCLSHMMPFTLSGASHYPQGKFYSASLGDGVSCKSSYCKELWAMDSCHTFGLSPSFLQDDLRQKIWVFALIY